MGYKRPEIPISGRYQDSADVVDSAVFQRTVDYPDEYAPGYHVVLDTGQVITVRWDPVKPKN